MEEQKSFSKQIDNFVFIFYPKAWTMPNMSIRHIHPGFSRNSYGLDLDGRCMQEKFEHLDKTVRNIRTKLVRCEAVVTDELKRQAIHDMLGSDAFAEGHVPSWFTETVTFKTSKVLTKLSDEWYVRRYTNTYTKGNTRWVFYHNCLKQAGMVSGDTFYKGTFDFIMPYLDKPWACQVCGTGVPSGLQMVSKLTKANIRM